MNLTVFKENGRVNYHHFFPVRRENTIQVLIYKYEDSYWYVPIFATEARRMEQIQSNLRTRPYYLKATTPFKKTTRQLNGRNLERSNSNLRLLTQATFGAAFVKPSDLPDRVSGIETVQLPSQLDDENRDPNYQPPEPNRIST